MDDDRTLLELAAKAAGYEVARWTDDGTALLLVGEQEPWGPLTDDGGALRLASKLRLDVYFHECGAMVNSEDGKTFDETTCHADPAAGARRAIVRAAAAMAQTTKEQP